MNLPGRIDENRSPRQSHLRVVVARKQRLAGYAAVEPTLDELLDSVEETNRVGAQFLKLDLQTAFTFVAIAREAPDDARMMRNRMAARRAYDTVLKLAGKIDLSREDAREITRSLTQLRSELRGLGETL